MKYHFLDFEFNKTQSRDVNTVCYSGEYGGELREIWLHNSDEERSRLKDILLEDMKEKPVLVSYSVEAEARALLSIGVDPLKFKWIDLYVEWLMLTNHCNKLAYGKQLIKGKEVKTYPPSYGSKNKNNSKPDKSLAAAAYKLLGVKVDTEHKTKMRDIIISQDGDEIEENREDIQAYCTSDIKYLKAMLQKTLKWYKKLIPKKYWGTIKEEMHLRAEYSVRTALMVREGYPFNVESTRNFSEAVPHILRECQREINGLFPDITIFKFKKDGTFSWNQKGTKEWIKSLPQKTQDYWVRTPTGDFSLSKDSFQKVFSYRHSYPKDCIGGQILRYLNLKQSLNGFLPPKKDKKSFWDCVGDDGRARPFFGIYGSQASRSQPAATGYMFLKSAWMRALVEPPPGKAIGAYDYKSQEFLLKGLMSGDMKMIEGYESGDVYLHTAKLDGKVPWDGERSDHEEIRDKYKSTVLGLQYLMTEVGLAVKLTNDTGEHHTEAQALKLIGTFDKLYFRQKLWSEKTIDLYNTQKYLKLPCGWYMFGGNYNHRSVANFPIQGFGASIMRKAVQLAQDAGLKVIFTLHDALYIEYDSDDMGAMDTLAWAMDEAFRFYFKGHKLEDRANVGLDGYCWSPDYDNETVYTPEGRKIKQSKKYIDGRAVDEYEKFSRYFDWKDKSQIL